MQQPPTRHDFGPSAQDEADLRAHAGFAATQDPVALQAAIWFGRRLTLDASEQAAFDAWLAADAAHARAYASMQKTQRITQQIPADITARWTVQAPAATAPAIRTRRHWLRALPYAAAAMLVLGVGAGSYTWWQQQATFSQAYATQRGQRLAINLPDGSFLQLDTATQINVTLYPKRREVQLLQGEAMFQVQAQHGLPFEVATGPLRVTVIGTKFSVRNTLKHDGNLRVAVQEGHVRVAGAQHGQVDLIAGQGVQADASGQLSNVSNLPPDSVAPWRNGRVTFDNLPLGQVLAEFERYGDTGLVVRDPAVARLRIGGSFSLTELGSFAASLPHLLPVRVVRAGHLSEIRMAPVARNQAPSMSLSK